MHWSLRGNGIAGTLACNGAVACTREQLHAAGIHVKARGGNSKCADLSAQ